MWKIAGKRLFCLKFHSLNYFLNSTLVKVKEDLFIPSIIQYRYHQPGRLWTVFNHSYLSLPPGLSKKSAYRLNVALMALASGTVKTKNYFALISHIFYIKKRSKSPGLWGDFEVWTPTNRHLNFHLQVQSCLRLKCLWIRALQSG